MEERRTVQDSQGHRETTVTRRRGDQAFITTTKEDGQRRDYREEVLNMDDRECVTPPRGRGASGRFGAPPRAVPLLSQGSWRSSRTRGRDRTSSAPPP